MTYTAEQVARVLPSVFDKEGFYLRGGTHTPEERIEGSQRVATSIDVHASMSAVCEVLDIERALAQMDHQTVLFLAEGAQDPEWAGRTQTRAMLYRAACQSVADLA